MPTEVLIKVRFHRFPRSKVFCLTTRLCGKKWLNLSLALGGWGGGPAVGGGEEREREHARMYTLGAVSLLTSTGLGG